MKKHTPCWTLLLLLCAAGAQAQLYKSVGPDGKVTYSDTPPSGNVKVEAKAISGGGPAIADLPYELQQAVQNNPVVLYSSQNCLPCDEGRKLLNARGIPFVEKTVSTNEDAVQFKTVAGSDLSLPVLLVGRQKERGFAAGAWNNALTIAGYPESSRLPKSYRQPAAQAAAPKPVVEARQDKPAAPARAAAATPNEPPPPAGNAPPGFRF